MNIYLDIETVPTNSQKVREKIAETIKAPAQYKKPESIEQWMVENKESAIADQLAKTSFDGAYGHIVCIGIAIDDQKAISYQAPSLDYEKSVIEMAFGYLSNVVGFDTYSGSLERKSVFIGHNIANFDLRFLFKRAVVLGIKPPSFIPFHAKPWDSSIYDTMDKWDSQNRNSLAKLCDVLGIPVKSGMDGSMVADYYAQGRIDEIAEYCREDVEATRSVYKRMTFQ